MKRPNAQDPRDQLIRTAPDTDMGRLLRRFWHPVALSRDLANGSAATSTSSQLLSRDLRNRNGSLVLAAIQTEYILSSGSPFAPAHMNARTWRPADHCVIFRIVGPDE